jgi:hypothetical protein
MWRTSIFGGDDDDDVAAAYDDAGMVDEKEEK